MNILDLLNFDAILNLTVANPSLHSLITDHCMIPKFRIHEKLIFINGNINRCSSIIADDDIFIGNIDMVLRFLRLNGHIITRLKFDATRYLDTEIKTIGQFIREYCSSTLLEFELVESMSLQFVSQSNHFPSLQNFSIQIPSSQSLDGVSIRLTFDHLQILEIVVENEYEPWASELIERNAQLRTISFPSTTAKHAIKYFKQLKQLKNLQEIRVVNAVDGDRSLLRILDEFKELRTVGVYFFDLPYRTTKRDAITRVIEERWGETSIHLTNSNFKFPLLSFTRGIQANLL